MAASLPLTLHIAAGLCTVAVGWAPIVTRKGSRWHRRFGRLFVALMSVLLAAAWVMTILRFSAYFAGLSTMATLTLFSGVRVLRRKRPDLRAADRARALDWIATVAAVGVALWVLALILIGRTSGPTPVAAALAASGLAYGGWDLWRFAQPTAWPFSPQLWTYEHLVKMLGAYGAAMSAFSGNFLTLLPAPWSQLWPTLVFQSLAVAWIVALASRRSAVSAPL